MSDFLKHKVKNNPKDIGFTVAASYNQEETSLKFGVAKCCKHDAFTKKIGRDIAKKRLETRPTFSIHIYEEDNIREKFNNTCEELATLLKRVNIKELKELKALKNQNSNEKKAKLKIVELSY